MKYVSFSESLPIVLLTRISFTFQIQLETIGLTKKRICLFLSNEEMEYFTDRRATLLAYGLLVRVGEYLV
ncbi:hypothetical protein I4U23_010499 [Adineta vaga]|nr:hypothetical protein I4U23_010499 [Adineta vaga]